jgi:hypothetical protein
MVQHVGVDSHQPETTLQVQSLKEIKKSRRTVLLGNDVLPIPVAYGDLVVPLTPPLSDRASGDVDDLFSPEREEHFESVDLSDAQEGADEVVETWDHSGDLEEGSATVKDPSSMGTQEGATRLTGVGE